MGNIKFHAVLNSPIEKGIGRRYLTSTECKALRALGYSCSEAYMVLQVGESSSLGAVYRSSGNGYDHTGIHVQTK